ncbi:hypothetical protein B0A55_12343, partial [Friedmanniomyces simplex]
ARVRPQLESVSACLDTLIIVSDVDEEYQGQQLLDVIADLPAPFRDNNKQLRRSGYYVQKAFADNGTLAGVNLTEIGVHGWKMDKFKFLPQVSRAWRMRPEKRWYVFYEGDTYVVWDNVFRLLSNFNPDVPLYFGSPSPGRDGSWMANGGEGYVLSREAVRRLVKHEFGEDGAFLGSKLSERWRHGMMRDCCGDSVLGWAVHEDAKTDLSGLWPMFNPHPLHGVPFSDRYWCQPVISMHKTTTESMVDLWRWEESRRELQRPLIYADLPHYLNLTKITIREDWDNADWDGYPAPQDSNAHNSFKACGDACKANDDCFQWTYHLRSCYFVRSFRLGAPKAAEVEESRTEDEWSHNDTRFMAGWDVEGIRRWMDGKGRDCKAVQWVKPSVERIY